MSDDREAQAGRDYAYARRSLSVLIAAIESRTVCTQLCLRTRSPRAYSVVVAASFKLRGASCRFRTPAVPIRWAPTTARFCGSTGRSVLRATADQTEGRFAAFGVAAAEGFRFASFPSEDEFFLVLSGEVRLQHGDDVVEGVAGSFIYSPRGIGHSSTSIPTTHDCFSSSVLPG